jgi:hypothetical protein
MNPPNNDQLAPPGQERVRFLARVRDGLRWNRLYHASSYLKSALWTVPFVAIALDLAATPALHALDAWLQWRPRGLEPAGANALYETVVTLGLSFLVFTFGSLLVAIQVAGGQLTSRIIATVLLRNNVVRYSVGLFVFTLVFAVGALNRQSGQVHELVALITALLGIACIANFLFLIDYAARLLRPVNVLAAVAEQGIAVIESVYPNVVTEKAAQGKTLRLQDWPGDRRTVTHEGTSSILLAADVATLVALAKAHDGLIEVVPQIGDFVAVDDPLFVLRGAATGLDDAGCARPWPSARSARWSTMRCSRSGSSSTSASRPCRRPSTIRRPRCSRSTSCIASSFRRAAQAAWRRPVRRGRRPARGDSARRTGREFVQLACSEIGLAVRTTSRSRGACAPCSRTCAHRYRTIGDRRCRPSSSSWTGRCRGISAGRRELALARIPDSQGLGGSSPDAEVSADMP